MQVTLTLRSGERERDVEITARAGTTVTQLAPLFGTLMSDPRTVSLFSGERLLPPHALLGDAGLRSGGVISVAADRPRISSAGSALQLRVISGPDSGHILALSRGRHLIGRGHEADLRLDDPDVSRRHAEVRVGPRGVCLCDLASTNGTYLNGEPVTAQACPVQPGETITVGGSRLCVVAVSEPPAAVTADGDGGLLVHRPPRIRGPLDLDPVEFPAEPGVAVRPRLPWLTALAPAILGVSWAVVMHNNQFLAFALLGPLAMLAGWAADRRHWRRGRANAQALHSRAESAARRELGVRLAAEEARRQRDFPDPAAVLQATMTPDCRLWERRPEEAGFLSVRVGIADQAAETTASQSGRLLPPEMITAAPATVSLLDGALGLAGPLPLARGSARWVVAQLLALHSPRDLSVVALLDGELAEWRWLRWACATVKAVATEPAGHRLLLEDLVSVITDRRARQSVASWSGPRIVLLLDRVSGSAGSHALGWVLEQGPGVGVTAVCVAENVRSLPPFCRSTGVLNAETGSVIDISRPGQAALPAISERVSPHWADQLARSLAPLRDADSAIAGELPSEVWLADLLGDGDGDISAETLLRRWTVSAGATTPIGIAATGRVEIDLLRDGPHLLIAGSTGSGKSELLRSLVTGLAARHAPDDVAFVLIDYKGGAAFADCADFPHTVGLVTDLDSHLTRRALASLDAEIRRRESAFAAAGVADLDAYRRTPLHQKSRMPRLVLVVDEFAFLAEELPAFLSGLIAVAQRGRSLGLHLVLATQRPAGVVSPQIKANISLRIALRVTDPAESQDVIGADVAHRISKNEPGRGFAQLAEGLVEFQTARIGRPAAVVEPITVTALDGWNRAMKPADAGVADDLQVLRTAMLEAAVQLERPLPQRPWLPPLPARVTVSELGEDPSAPFTIRFGLADDPGRQRQYVTSHDLIAGGSIGFVGGPRSGRTGALHTILARACAQLDASQLHLYVMDCSGHSFGHFSRLPHCGAVVNRDDPRAVARLSARLVEELAARKRMLASLGLRTVAEAHVIGKALPVILVALDGWEGFTALSDGYDAGRSVEALLRLLRDGAAAGITVLIAGDRAMLGLRIAPALSRKLLLALIDRSDYATAGLSMANLPARFGPGRAVCAAEGVEVQLALLSGETGPGAEQAVVDRIEPDRAALGRGPTIKIRSLPETVRRAQLVTCPAARDGDEVNPDQEGPREPGDCLLGVGGDDAQPVWTTLFRDHTRFLIAGPPTSGRSTAAVLIARQALEAGLTILVAAPAASLLAAWAARRGLAVLGPGSPADRDGAFAGQMVLIDDVEQFNDTATGSMLSDLAAGHPGPVVATTRSDDLAASFRGPAVALRRRRTGLLLQPSGADGELLGIRTGLHPLPTLPGRGLLVTDAIRRTAPDGLALQVAV